LKARQSQATIYKQDRARHYSTGPHMTGACAADHGEIAPVYRGFKLTCTSTDLPRLQKAIDKFWLNAYFGAQTPAAREAVVQQEKEYRCAPREWQTC
jgi:hypothetical protein